MSLESRSGKPVFIVTGYSAAVFSIKTALCLAKLDVIDGSIFLNTVLCADISYFLCVTRAGNNACAPARHIVIPV